MRLALLVVFLVVSDPASEIARRYIRAEKRPLADTQADAFIRPDCDPHGNEHNTLRNCIRATSTARHGAGGPHRHTYLQTCRVHTKSRLAVV